MDLESHSSLAKNLGSVLLHLDDHRDESGGIDSGDVENLRTRLDRALEWWKKICHNSATWQARLQIALMEVSHSNLYL